MNYQGEEIFWEEEINFYLHSEGLTKECDASLVTPIELSLRVYRSSFGNSVHLSFCATQLINYFTLKRHKNRAIKIVVL